MDVAYCPKCGRELKPAPARFDGEPTYVGYLPCPVHGGDIQPVYEKPKELGTTNDNRNQD